MSGFKNKSQQNTTAADLLINNSLFSSSIHCSYYSCVQTLLHVLAHKMNIDFGKFLQDAKDNNQGTHKRASFLVGEEIRKKSNNDYKWFQRRFKELKALRERADYHEEVMISDDGHDAKRRNEEICRFLAQKFN